MNIVTKEEYKEAVKIVKAYQRQISEEFQAVKKQLEAIPEIHLDENSKMNDLGISVRLRNMIYQAIYGNIGYGFDRKNPKAKYISPDCMTIKEISDLVNYKDFCNQRNCGPKTCDEYLRILCVCGVDTGSDIVNKSESSLRLNQKKRKPPPPPSPPPRRITKTK